MTQISYATTPAPTIRLSHKKRAKRRLEILEKLNSGENVDDLATEYNLTTYYIKSLLRGSDPKLAGKPVYASTYKIIALLCRSKKSLASIARRLEVDENVVSGIYTRCRKAGIPVRLRKKGRTTLSETNGE